LIKAALRYCLNALAETGAERPMVDERLEISRQFLKILDGADAER